MVEGSVVLGAVSSVFTATFKIAEKVYQLKAVDEATKNVLTVAADVSERLQAAQTLRRQKSFLLSTFEKTLCETSFRTATDAIAQIQDLVEGPRADMSATKGSITLKNRILYVVRDSSQVPTCLFKLTNANTGLTGVLTTLSARQPSATASIRSDLTSVQPAPPPYEDYDFLNMYQQKNLDRRNTARRRTGSAGSPIFVQNEAASDEAGSSTTAVDLGTLEMIASNGSSDGTQAVSPRGRERSQGWLDSWTS